MSNAIYDKVTEIVSNFTTVTVTTRVTNGEVKEIKTETNVVTGDIQFEIHEDYVVDKSTLNDFHQEQVINGIETLKATFEALGTLAEKVGDKLEGEE